jgi:3'-5' exoribonuclease 1
MQNFLNLQCFHSKISYPRWAKKWIDVRKLFSNWFGVRRCNIENMLSFLGFEFEGHQHCGSFFFNFFIFV